MGSDKREHARPRRVREMMPPHDSPRIALSPPMRLPPDVVEQNLSGFLETFGPHDHLCLIYENKEEWRNSAVPFIATGLRKGERCIYVVDSHTANEIRQCLTEEGVDVSQVEQSGQFTILSQSEAYTSGGSFDPDRMIGLLIEETSHALAKGYPALRVTGEMTWVLRGHPGSERVLEYEAKLNRDLFPHHKCLAMCQYDRWAFEPETMKGVIVTHPLLVRGSNVYRNFFYIPAEEYLNSTKAAREAQQMLNNLERERRHQESLCESEERYRSLFEQSSDAIYVTSEDGLHVDANQAWLDLFGYTNEDLASFDARSAYADSSDRDDFLRRIAATGAVRDEVRFKKKDGTEFDCERAVVALRNANGTVRFQGIHRDITERKRAEQAIRQSEERLRELAAHLEEVREEERTGIARELHDQVGQSLTAIKMDLRGVAHSAREGMPIDPEKLDAVVTLIDAATDDVRHISSELRPGILDDLGLAAAIEWQLGCFEHRTGIRCVLTASSCPEPQRSTSTALYRVFQELLTNVARHAEARSVRVDFAQQDNSYVLTVTDDGRGITQHEIDNTTSLGLIGIRERLRPLGGEITFSGTPGEGTIVRVTVPVA
jgi:PAS domain S-box-containing protein